MEGLNQEQVFLFSSIGNVGGLQSSILHSLNLRYQEYIFSDIWTCQMVRELVLNLRNIWVLQDPSYGNIYISISTYFNTTKKACPHEYVNKLWYARDSW